jgi:hypothetical protein
METLPAGIRIAMWGGTPPSGENGVRAAWGGDDRSVPVGLTIGGRALRAREKRTGRRNTEYVVDSVDYF